MSEGATFLPEMGTANLCVVATLTAHTPTPVRFVWHHVQPKEAGGQTVAANLIEICDNCHYTIHRLMWYMRLQNEGTALTPDQLALLARPPRKNQLLYATKGFSACVAAGTVGQIPNEG